MLRFLSNTLLEFRSCFSRNATFENFVIFIIGLMVRSSKQGITSIIAFLHLEDRKYDSLLNLFRSNAYQLRDISTKWVQIVGKFGHLYKINGRNLLVGDGTKQPKEARHTPGVSRMHQESDDVSKPEYIFGHDIGCIGVIHANGEEKVCTPLRMFIQNFLKDTVGWPGSDPENAFPFTVQTARKGYEIAKHLGGSSYIVLDRAYLSVPLLQELNRLNAEKHVLDVITRAKSNVVAFEDPPVRTGAVGRPRKKGDSVKLSHLFQERASDFTKAEVTMYGEQETVEYLEIYLLWGEKHYQKLKFVLVQSSKGQSIFVSTDLDLDAISIMEAYTLRFKIELTIKVLKQRVGGFLYHFWSKSMPEVNHFRKSENPSELSQVTDPAEQRRILATAEAVQRYLQFSCIVLGLAQMIALTPLYVRKIQKEMYLRTVKEGITSAVTVFDYLQQNIFCRMGRIPSCLISRLIFENQKPESEDDDDLSDIA